MGIIIAAVLAIYAGSVGLAWHYGSTSAVASYQQKQEQAQAKIEEQAATIEKQGTEKIAAMQESFEAGKAQAQVITKTITIRGQSDVAKYPVFSNPVCVLPPDSLLYLNRARANLRTAADPGIADAALPVAGPTPGRQDINPVPAVPSRREPVGTVGNVHSKPRPANSSGQIPR